MIDTVKRHLIQHKSALREDFCCHMIDEEVQNEIPMDFILEFFGNVKDAFSFTFFQDHSKI